MPKPPPGLRGYGWETLLGIAGLVTVTMLRRERKRPAEGQEPIGYYWSGHAFVLLYRAAEAVDMPPLSPGRQRLWDAARTCARCDARAVEPWAKGRDGRRFCEPCHGPAAQELWKAERAADRPVIAAWAAGVVDDPRVAFAASVRRDYWREVHVADLDGNVLLDTAVRYSARPVEPTHPRAAELSAVASPADIVEQVAALADRRLIAWWPSTAPALATEFDTDGAPANLVTPLAAEDAAGRWYSRWVGELAGASYRHHPRLADQAPPWEPREQVTRMRALVWAMAAGQPDGSGAP